jgi:hypothetical protein
MNLSSPAPCSRGRVAFRWPVSRQRWEPDCTSWQSFWTVSRLGRAQSKTRYPRKAVGIYFTSEIVIQLETPSLTNVLDPCLCMWTGPPPSIVSPGAGNILLRRHGVQKSKCRFWCRLRGNPPLISPLNWTEDGLNFR